MECWLFFSTFSRIWWLIHIFRKEELDDQTLHYLRIISKNAHLLLFMIADLLDYSRINKNQLRLCWSYFKIEDIVQEIIDLIALQAIDKHIKVNYIMSFESLTLYSDPNRIK
jgi:signal transduction histidine kinase